MFCACTVSFVFKFLVGKQFLVFGNSLNNFVVLLCRCAVLDLLHAHDMNPVVVRTWAVDDSTTRPDSDFFLDFIDCYCILCMCLCLPIGGWYVGPMQVTSPVGNVTVTTDYPFGDSATVEVAMANTSPMNVHLRIPSWSVNTTVQVNAGPILKTTTESYFQENQFCDEAC